MFLFTCVCENHFKKVSWRTKTADLWAKIVANCCQKHIFLRLVLGLNMQIHNDLTVYFC